MSESQLPGRSQFQDFYLGQPPWDIGRPQRSLVEVADAISGRVLDSGCGTGENALYFAERGCDVTGLDYVATPIERARRKAVERDVSVDFLVADALALGDCHLQFDAVIDCGLFHVFSDDERAVYVQGLADIVVQGGRVFMLCFSEDEPGTEGPRRVSRDEIRMSFADGWEVESIEPARFEVVATPDGPTFSPGGPKAWFSRIKRWDED